MKIGDISNVKALCAKLRKKFMHVKMRFSNMNSKTVQNQITYQKTIINENLIMTIKLPIKGGRESIQTDSRLPEQIDKKKELTLMFKFIKFKHNYLYEKNP